MRAMDKIQMRFGATLRKARLAKGVSLRRFAEQVGVSPTYLSQVETANVTPPTADRVRRMAILLNENADDWIALAGRVSDDLPDIIGKKPIEILALLRAVRGLTRAQLDQLRQQAERMKGNGASKRR